MKRLSTILQVAALLWLSAGWLCAGLIINPYAFTVPSGGTPDYGNAGGTGDRRGSITMSSSLTSNGPAISNMIDGNAADASGPWFASLPDAATIEWDFGTARLITEATFKYNTSVVFGNWKWQGWNGSSWVDIGTSFTLGGGSGTSPTQVLTELSGNTTSYTKYRILKTGGTGANWYWNEFTFKIL